MHVSSIPWAMSSFLVGLFLVLVVIDAHAVGWSERAPMPVPRQEVAVAELNGLVYVIGGYFQDASVADNVDVYDPDTDSWTTAASLPLPIHHAAAVTVGGKLYVVGGCRYPFVPLATLFEYDSVSDNWIQRASMPSQRCSLAVAALDGKIYAMGGSPPLREHDFAVYDPVFDQWTALSDMPTGRNHLAAGVAAGRVYALGGRTGGISGILPVVEEYNPGTGIWATKTPMPTARGGVASASLGQYILMFGGEGNPLNPDGVFEDVEAYDSVADDWISLPPMPTPRHGIGAVLIGQSVYIPGGASQQGLGVTGVQEVFDAEGISSFMGVFCDVSVNQQSYETGEDVIASRIRIANLAKQPVKVELKAWVEGPPPSQATPVLNLGATGSLILPRGVDADLPQLHCSPLLLKQTQVFIGLDAVL
ncbi:MAG: galactose oxidase [Gammaproteobacteria bacterium]|nr:galactose oxidase [Gammaproteobacteria bacterium]